MQMSLVRVENPGRKGLTLTEALNLLIRQSFEIEVQLSDMKEELLATFQEAKDAVKALDAKVDALIGKVGQGENPEHQAAFDEIKSDADALGAKLDSASKDDQSGDVSGQPAEV